MVLETTRSFLEQAVGAGLAIKIMTDFDLSTSRHLHKTAITFVWKPFGHAQGWDAKAGDIRLIASQRSSATALSFALCRKWLSMESFAHTEVYFAVQTEPDRALQLR